MTEEMVVSCLGAVSCNDDVIFIYCNLVSTSWLWSVDLYKNRKETAQKENQYKYTEWKTKIQNKKKTYKEFKKHKSSDLKII